MKIVKKYIFVALALALATPLFSGCTNEEEYSMHSVSAKPADKFNTKIQFVSRLTDGALIANDADYTAVNGYMVNTLKGQEGSWLTVLDRTDNTMFDKVMTIALNSHRWTAVAFNQFKSSTAHEGSTICFNQPTRLTKSIASGTGCYVTGFAPLMQGTRTDKDEAGTVTGTEKIAFNINFRTVRFSTEGQINAFGGETGVMNTLKRDKMNMLMIGTVKNELLSHLQATVAATDGTFHVTTVATGSAYTIFILNEERFWGMTGFSSVALGGGIEAYTIDLMW